MWFPEWLTGNGATLLRWKIEVRFLPRELIFKTNKMTDFNKETELNELMAIFSGGDNIGFTEQLKRMGRAIDKVEQIYLQGYENGLEAGLKKIEINDESN